MIWDKFSNLVPRDSHLPEEKMRDPGNEVAIFLLLEQIAPSPVAHVRTCCEDFRGCRAGKMATEIPETV